MKSGQEVEYFLFEGLPSRLRNYLIKHLEVLGLLGGLNSKNSIKVILPPMVEAILIDNTSRFALVGIDMRFKEMLNSLEFLDFLLADLIRGKLVF